MRFRSTLLLSTLLLPSVASFASPRTRRGPTSPHLSTRKAKPAAQRAIDSDRTSQIQAALIAQGYLTGSPTGTWTPETESALRKLQEANGWQTKFVPDSRAIIKLGLNSGAPVPEAFSSASSVHGQTDVESAIPAQR